jgi:hypothetical protein
MARRQCHSDLLLSAHSCRVFGLHPVFQWTLPSGRSSSPDTAAHVGCATRSRLHPPVSGCRRARHRGFGRCPSCGARDPRPRVRRAGAAGRPRVGAAGSDASQNETTTTCARRRRSPLAASATRMRWTTWSRRCRRIAASTCRGGAGPARRPARDRVLVCAMVDRLVAVARGPRTRAAEAAAGALRAVEELRPNARRAGERRVLT